MGILENKSVIITGAGAGLGRAYAEHALGEGANLVLNDISASAAAALEEGLRAFSDRVVVTVGDVGVWSYADSLVALCLDRFGEVDGLVNNAGICHLAKPWEDGEDRLARLYQTNVMGSIYCGVHVMRAMVAQRFGSILNVTSGAHVGLAGLSAYGGTKGAIASLTYNWAIELRDFGVRVNALSPRARTTIVAPSPSGDSRKGPQWDPAHTAPLVSFLLSDLAAGVTGQVVRLSGDELSVMAHPWETRTSLIDEDWGVTNVTAAFQTTFGNALRPIGLEAGAANRREVDPPAC